MYINKINLENIRNYENEIIEFNRNINIIIGKNGQGKTNLIESIYVSAFSKSFRTNNEKEIVGFNKEVGKIEVSFTKQEEIQNIEYYINNIGKKNIKINGLKINKVRDLIGNLLVVVFYPDDLKIVKEDPEKRRGFMDRELCQLSLSYLISLQNYKKTLLQRNKYLKEININKDILEVWDLSLCDHGNKIIKKRKEFVEKLNKISGKIYNNIKKEETLKLKYESNIKENENFKDILNENYEKDVNNRNTLRGPHKDDIKILINDVDARKFASQGQQRSAALAIKLAEIEIIKEEKKESPVVLLDDVLSELDEERQELIVKNLNDVQLFITTTNISNSILANLRGNDKVYNIEKGKLLRKE